MMAPPHLIYALLSAWGKSIGDRVTSIGWPTMNSARAAGDTRLTLDRCVSGFKALCIWLVRRLCAQALCAVLCAAQGSDFCKMGLFFHAIQYVFLCLVVFGYTQVAKKSNRRLSEGILRGYFGGCSRLPEGRYWR